MSGPVKRNAGEKGAAWVFLLYLGLLIYWMLGVAGTSARDLTIDGMVNLPALGFKVPLNLFFLFMPVAAIFLYLLLCRKAGPEQVLSDILLPLCLLVNALWFLRSHQPVWPVVLGASIPIGVFFVIWNKRPPDTGLKNWPLSRKVICAGALLGAFFLFAVFLFFLIPWSKVGKLPQNVLLSRLGDPVLGLIRADLSHQDLSAGQGARSADPPAVDLSAVHLEGADLTYATLKGIKLRGAQLKNAYMMYADLDGADLQAADFREINLTYTSLQGADLSKADLRGIYARYTDMQNANFSHSDLRAARLLFCNATGADFTAGKFEAAYIFQSDLSKAKLPKADLKNNNLALTDFSNADLSYADLQNTYLWKVNFYGADLTGANLLEARELEVKQLLQAKTLFQAKLDPDILAEIRRIAPKLLR